MENILYEIKSLDILIIRKFMQTNNIQLENLKKKLTPSQMQIIHFILSSKEKIYQKDIEKKLKLRRATISGILKTMETNGLITRKQSLNDARSKEIILSNNIRTTFEKCQEEFNNFEKKILNNISKEEIKTFMNVLNKIKINIKDEGKNENDKTN